MKEISISGTVDSRVVTDYLDNLSKSIKSGKIVIHKGNDEVILAPEKRIDFKVEAKQKKDKEKLELKMSWYRNRKSDESVTVNVK